MDDRGKPAPWRDGYSGNLSGHPPYKARQIGGKGIHNPTNYLYFWGKKVISHRSVQIVADGK